MYRDEVNRVLRLGELEDEDGRQPQQQRGGWGRVVQRRCLRRQKCDEEGKEEVGNDNGGEEK